MTYREKPENFIPKFEIVSCFVEYDGKIIILRRQENKSQGGRWGLPAGKVEPAENLENAIIREIKEETGLDIRADNIVYFGQTYHRHSDYDFIFHTFSSSLDIEPKIIINPREHQAFAWKTPREVLAMAKDQIVEDLDYVCKLFYNIT